MKTPYNQLVLLIFMMMLIGCSSPEENDAVLLYEKGKSTHNLVLSIKALKTLSNLNPGQYRNELVIAEEAMVHIKNADRYLEQGNYYLAYIESHTSYRKLYSIESKKYWLK